MDSCGVDIGMELGFGMTTLGGDSVGRSSWGWHIGRIIERFRVRVCGSMVQCGFVCTVIVVFVHRWMAWWSASIAKS